MSSSAHNSLKNHFLVAMPNMDDVQFDRAVVYLCEHTPEGAMGIIVNRPTEIQLEDMVKDMDMTPQDIETAQITVFDGGPVQTERGFVLHQNTPNHKWAHSVQLTETLSITTSFDILRAICNKDGPDRFVITLGFCQWAPGQLEDEIRENLWLHVPARESLVFDVPSEACWLASGALLGVDLRHIMTEVGHA
ncbi:MAG: YqgE/AlgH family protein [Legionellales bacterium]|nr:YqgE/AlgH family protein [Legionellales bacterium]|tara:strand:- start:67 stop:642 length:576 start_codon:yes stop_codon:yes gene_type:complete